MSLEIRVANLEAAFRRLENQPQNAQSTASSSSTAATLVTFLASRQTVQANTTGTVAWTEFNAASLVPSGTQCVILESTWALVGPDSGDIDANIKFRSKSGAIELNGSRGRAAGSSDATAGVNQTIVPLSSRRTFDFTIEAPGFDGGASIDLVGYIK